MIMNPDCRNKYCEFNSKDCMPGRLSPCCVAERLSITNTGECETYWLSVAEGRSPDFRESPEYKGGSLISLLHAIVE